MNIQITDDFRYVLIDEGQNQNQKESQTSNINSYYIKPENKDFPPIKIIDTPGFGDTRENFDESLLKKFKNYFDNENFIDLICFVIKSTNNRYTEFQKYIMSNILGLFGKDLVSNFLVLFTFCDGNQPNFIDSLKSNDNPFSKIIKEISDPWFLKFNNSAFFSEKSQKFQDLFWNMSCESFFDFINKLKNTQTKSLKLSKNVLNNRNKILLDLEKINEKYNKCLEIKEQLNSELKTLEFKNFEIKLNSNFKTTVSKDIYKKIDVGPGNHNLICIKCNSTCHKLCEEINIDTIENCINISNGFCKICKCNVNEHKDLPYYIVKTIKKENVFNNKVYKKFDDACIEFTETNSKIDVIKNELENNQKLINDCVKEIEKKINKLNEIALHSNIYNDQENYFKYKINVENSERKNGYMKRISNLKIHQNNCYKLGNLFRNKNFFDEELNEYKRTLNQSMKNIKDDVYNTYNTIQKTDI